MADDWKTSVKNTLDTLMGQINDASKLTVETRVFNIDDAASTDETGRLISKSEITIDGDIVAGVPVHADNKVEQPLMQLHDANLAKALEYRANLVKTILDVVRQLGEMLEK